MVIPFMELDPVFIIRTGNTRQRFADVSLEKADGVLFLCPKCFEKNGGSIGTHSVICWKPHIPQDVAPKPGRWTFTGTGLNDLTITPSVNLDVVKGGCKWHGFIRNGEAT